MKTYVIDGNDFSTLAGFAESFSRTVLDGPAWDGNLDAFNDILRGGCGTPDGGFTLVWRNASKSGRDLGHAETVRWYASRLRTCHASNRDAMARGLEAARRGEGETVFDWLIRMLRDHGPGGSEAEDGVILRLE
jgi:RNAse (barnase) inhibitor barstar